MEKGTNEKVHYIQIENGEDRIVALNIYCCNLFEELIYALPEALAFATRNRFLIRDR